MATVLPLWGVESKITQRGKLKGSVATINFQLGQYGCEASKSLTVYPVQSGGGRDVLLEAASRTSSVRSTGMTASLLRPSIGRLSD